MGNGLPELARMIRRSGHRLVGMVQTHRLMNSWGNRRKMRYRMRITYSRVRRSPSSWDTIARQNRLPYLRTFDVTSPGVADWVRDRSPDLLVVYAAPLLPAHIFSLPPLGSVNIHPALLPSYRGPNPFFWMAYDMELNPGVTVHYIDAGMDTGDILAAGAYRLWPGRNWRDSRSEMVQLTEALLMPLMNRIARGSALRRPQPEASPTPPARLVSNSDYEALLERTSWTPIRLWHFLRCTENWLNRWLNPGTSLLSHGLVWSVGSCHPPSAVDEKDIRLVHKDGTYFLAFPQCRIRLFRRFDIRVWGQKILFGA